MRGTGFALSCYLAAWPTLLIAKLGRRLWGGGADLPERLEFAAMTGFLIAMPAAVAAIAD